MEERLELLSQQFMTIGEHRTGESPRLKEKLKPGLLTATISESPVTASTERTRKRRRIQLGFEAIGTSAESNIAQKGEFQSYEGSIVA